MNLVDKKYLVLMALEKIWLEKLTQVVEVSVDQFRKHITDSEIEYLLQLIEREEKIIEIFTRPPYESGHYSIYRHFSYKLRINNNFDEYIKLLRDDERYRRMRATTYSTKEGVVFPEEYGWVDDKTYCQVPLFSIGVFNVK